MNSRLRVAGLVASAISPEVLSVKGEHRSRYFRVTRDGPGTAQILTSVTTAVTPIVRPVTTEKELVEPITLFPCKHHKPESDGHKVAEGQRIRPVP